MSTGQRRVALVDWLLEQVADEESGGGEVRRAVGAYRDCAADIDLGHANDSVSPAQERAFAALTADLRRLARRYSDRAGYLEL